jgi:hypothetical protein
MKLMDEKRQVLIKHSWKYATGDKGFGSVLCKMMIDVSSDLKPVVTLLRTKDQMSQVLETLNKIVISLPDFTTTEPEVIAFASRFSGSGITNERYEAGVIALLMTLEKKVKAWTPEFREAWIFLFASIHLHFVKKVCFEPRLAKLLQRKNNLQHEK